MTGSGRMVLDFAAAMEADGQARVTIPAALEWATANQAAAPGHWRARLSAETSEEVSALVHAAGLLTAPASAAMLSRYAAHRDRLCPQSWPAFFVTRTGRRVTHRWADEAFARLLALAAIDTPPGRPPSSRPAARSWPGPPGAGATNIAPKSAANSEDRPVRSAAGVLEAFSLCDGA